MSSSHRSIYIQGLFPVPAMHALNIASFTEKFEQLKNKESISSVSIKMYIRGTFEDVAALVSATMRVSEQCAILFKFTDPEEFVTLPEGAKERLLEWTDLPIHLSTKLVDRRFLH